MRSGRGVRAPGRVVGLGLVGVGVLLLVGVAIFYAYGYNARSQLHRLNTSLGEAVSLPAEAAGSGFEPVTSAGTNDSSAGAVSAPASQASALPAGSGRSGLAVAGYADISPGIQLHPKYWDRPLWAGTDPRPTDALPQGYRVVSARNGPSMAIGAPATRIRIPVINVDSTVQELGIVNLGDSLAYETPKNTVGHIPETENPGQRGNGWFFGHLESPITREGNVFFRLPKIAEYLRNGDPVYVSLQTDAGEFLYQVSATRVVHQDELRLYDSDQATITLVACVPRLVYDHRLLVTAKLVGIKN